MVFVAAFVAIVIFYYFNQKNKIRRRQRKGRHKEIREEQLQRLLELKRKQQNK